MSTIDDPDHRALLRRYATWHHLRRARTLAAAGRLRPGYIDTSRQSMSIAAQFLDFLATCGRTLQKTRQADIDAWLVGGPSTRTLARAFVRWAIRHQHIPKVDFPYRTAKMTPVLGQQERLALLRELLDNDPPRPLPHRTAGLLLLFYAQPIKRIAAVRIGQLGQDEHGATITFDEQPVPIPEPFAAVITEHRHNRPNMSTATNVGSAWLFPGYRAGQHIRPSYLRTGLPRVNRLTDYYNAVSVLHQIPVGGEDLTRYAGPPRLVRAAGTEPFDTTADGIAVTEHPDPGEVVWRDDAGVTCRRWNWRQARRTQLREDTTAALFILDALDPVTDQALHAAADDLTAHLTRLGPGIRAARRLINAAPAPADRA